jgi:type IV pilus assembly PilX-like protein
MARYSGLRFGLSRPPSAKRMPAADSRGERGAALVITILILAILTVIGVALLLVTSTESRIAANEWGVNRAFYASDAGIRWGGVQMTDPQAFMTRSEFQASPFGTVFFELPSHRHGPGAFFGADTGDTGHDIAVRIQRPSLLGRRPAPGGRINEGDEGAQFIYAYELRSTSVDQAFGQFSNALVADIEVGPLPGRLPF